LSFQTASNTGAALGVQSVATNLGQTGGPIIGGILFTLSIDTPFLLGGAVLFSTGLVVIWYVAFTPVLAVSEEG
jgi:DHA1 family multidrug resistance protein-like MFS transporter